MKKKLLYFISFLIILASIILVQKYNKEKEYMENLLLHQPIELTEVDAIHLWEKGREIKTVPTNNYIKIVKWFNNYDPTRVKEEKIPNANAQVVIDKKNGATIVIHYINEKVYVSRNDVGAGGIDYMFIDDAPKIEGFFKEGLD